MSATTTAAPSAARTSTVALPNPDAAPVTIATLPSKLAMLLSCFDRACYATQLLCFTTLFADPIDTGRINLDRPQQRRRHSHGQPEELLTPPEQHCCRDCPNQRMWQPNGSSDGHALFGWNMTVPKSTNWPRAGRTRAL